MLVFIIPIKSAKISKDWALTSRLFERCLRAICNQKSPNFRVVVVCNERPDTQFSHPNVHYLEVDFPPPLPDPTEEATHGYEFGFSKDIARKNADKARKIHAGLDYAACYAPTHSMVVDADDLVSNRLAEFVAQNPQGTGWYFKKGYFHTEGSRFLYLNRRNFNVVCGSSVIVPYGRRQIVFLNPDFYQHCFYEPLDGLVPLPFVGGVYCMATGDNIYMSAQTRNNIYGTLLKRIFSRKIFSVLWRAVNYWPTFLTEAKRKEYGLYELTEPPVAASAPKAKQQMETVAS